MTLHWDSSQLIIGYIKLISETNHHRRVTEARLDHQHLLSRHGHLWEALPRYRCRFQQSVIRRFNEGPGWDTFNLLERYHWEMMLRMERGRNADLNCSDVMKTWTQGWSWRKSAPRKILPGEGFLGSGDKGKWKVAWKHSLLPKCLSSICVRWGDDGRRAISWCEGVVGDTGMIWVPWAKCTQCPGFAESLGES